MGELQTLFGQLWKEYALSDSRYLTQNAFVLCMESLTAVGIMNPSIPRRRKPFSDRRTDLLGSSIICCGRNDYHSTPSSTPSPGHGISRTGLRRRAVLRYEHV